MRLEESGAFYFMYSLDRYKSNWQRRVLDSEQLNGLRYFAHSPQMRFLSFHIVCAYLSLYTKSAAVPVESDSPQWSDQSVSSIGTNETAILDSDYKSDVFWNTVNDATIRAKLTRPSARPLYIRKSLIPDQISTLIEIVFDAYPRTLYMKRKFRYASEWDGPMLLPPGFQYPLGLEFFRWSEVHLGMDQVLHLLYATDCFIQAKAAYNTWEIYEEPGRPMQVWFYLSEGVGVRYQTMRVNAHTGQIIKGDPIESSNVTTETY